jgi:hypothetical protein
MPAKKSRHARRFYAVRTNLDDGKSADGPKLMKSRPKLNSCSQLSEGARSRAREAGGDGCSPRGGVACPRLGVGVSGCSSHAHAKVVSMAPGVRSALQPAVRWDKSAAGGRRPTIFPPAGRTPGLALAFLGEVAEAERPRHSAVAAALRALAPR